MALTKIVFNQIIKRLLDKRKKKFRALISNLFHLFLIFAIMSLELKGLRKLQSRDADPVFYCNVKFQKFLDEEGALFLADNGVVLSYQTIPAKYLTFHTRPPHKKKNPAGRQWKRRAWKEGVPRVPKERGRS